MAGKPFVTDTRVIPTPGERGKLLATRGDGAKLYQIEAGPDGGTVQIVDAKGVGYHLMKLGNVLAHNPYWDFIEPA